MWLVRFPCWLRCGAAVGTSWTLELYQLSRGTPTMTLVDWISSGVPISQPEPEALAEELAPLSSWWLAAGGVVRLARPSRSPPRDGYVRLEP